MHLKTLKIYCDVVRLKSFSEGARQNEVSQSAVSQAIHQLEKRLRARLIDRSTRPWVLTPEGQEFYEGCREILARFDELESRICPRSPPPGYTVRVAAIYSVGFHDMKECLDRFRTSYPGAEVELSYMHPGEVYERVLGGTADLGLISFARRARNLEAVPWRREKMVLACSPGHRLAAETEIDPQALQGERFVSFERRLPIRRAVGRFLKGHGVQIELVADFDNIETIKQAVEEGTGIAILPEPTLRREVERRALVAVPFRGTPFERPLSVILHRGRRHHPAVADFVHFLCPGAPRLGADAAGDVEARADHAAGANGTAVNGASGGAGGKASGRAQEASRNGRRAGKRRGSRRRVRNGQEHHG